MIYDYQNHASHQPTNISYPWGKGTNEAHFPQPTMGFDLILTCGHLNYASDIIAAIGKLSPCLLEITLAEAGRIPAMPWMPGPLVDVFKSRQEAAGVAEQASDDLK